MKIIAFNSWIGFIETANTIWFMQVHIIRQNFIAAHALHLPPPLPPMLKYELLLLLNPNRIEYSFCFH